MPATLRVALAVLLAQFVALAGLLILFVSMVVRQPSALGLYVTVFGVAMAVALYVCIRLLHHRRVAGRGGALAMQLLLLAPVYYMITGGFWLGWVLAASIIAVLVFLFAPPTGTALSRDGLSRDGLSRDGR